MRVLKAHRRLHSVDGVSRRRVMIGADNTVSDPEVEDVKRTAKGITIGLLLVGLAGILIIATED